MLYLAYGMNTNIDQMSGRCPGAVSLGRWDLANHRLVFRGPADVEYSPGDVVQCVLWDITKECELSLDRLEGYPTFYGKKYVPVTFHGMKHRAMIYQMNDQDGYYSPSNSYVWMLEEGYATHGLDLDQIYSANGYQEIADKHDNVYNY